MFNFSLRQTLLAATLSCALSPAIADSSAIDLDGIVVTASRTAQTQDETLAAITVIDRAEIERLQPQSLQDLLRGTPGLSLSNNGGPGKSSSMFLRGTESDHVLVLVDGIKLGSATSGGGAIQDIPVAQIERIEIVRGPFSSLYGSEAIGGVIQIFTRRPHGAFAPHFSAGIGSDNERRLSAGVGGTGAQGWYSVNAAHQTTDGINACRGKPSPGGGGCFVDQPDRDGYRNSSVVAQGGYRFNDAWEAEARAFRAEGRNEYDGSINDEADTVQRVASGRLRYKPADNVTLNASIGNSADLSDNYLQGAYVGAFNTRRTLGSAQADIVLGGGLASIGYDWQRDRIDSNTEYARDHRIDRGLFGQWQQDFGPQSLQASLRRDEDSQFGGKTTGSALWGWDFTDALRLTASYGTAFKAPTFNELYFPGYGNPALTPENSHSFELGLRGEYALGVWSLNGYESRINDLIAFDAATYAPGNIDRARIRGVEAAVDVSLAGWSWRASASWLDPRNDGRSSNQGNVLPRRARHSARIDADRAFGALSVGASVYAAGKRYDDLGNTKRLSGYALTDLRIGYAFSPIWDVRLSASNVFDRQYETALYFNQPGRAWLLSVNYRPAP